MPRFTLECGDATAIRSTIKPTSTKTLGRHGTGLFKRQRKRPLDADSVTNMTDKRTQKMQKVYYELITWLFLIFWFDEDSKQTFLAPTEKI